MEEFSAGYDVRKHLGSLLFNEHLSDVQLSVGPHQHHIYAHRVVLASASEPLQKMLLGGHKEAESAVVLLPQDDPDDIRQLLRFIYCGALTVTPSSLFGVFTVARKYGERPIVSATL